MASIRCHKCGPVILNSIWASFGKDMAHGALANVAVSLKWPAYDGTNVAQLS